MNVLLATIGSWHRGQHYSRCPTPVNTSLLRALRIVIAADSDPVRQVLFANLMQARRSVRVAYRLHARFAGTWASAVIVSGYGLAYFLRISPPAARRPDSAVAKHVNARRQVDRIGGWVGLEHCHRIRIGFGIGATMAGTGAARLCGVRPRPVAIAAHHPRARPPARVSGRLPRRRRRSPGTRGPGRSWPQHRPGAVLVSSDSNPEEVGFTARGAALAVPRVFVSHAYPTPFSPPLELQPVDSRRRGGGARPPRARADRRRRRAGGRRRRVGADRPRPLRSEPSR